MMISKGSLREIEVFMILYYEIIQWCIYELDCLV